jgi:membrane-bound lytic murein transglycosylase B
MKKFNLSPIFFANLLVSVLTLVGLILPVAAVSDPLKSADKSCPALPTTKNRYAINKAMAFNQHCFQLHLQKLKTEARRRGISEKTINRTFPHIKLLPSTVTAIVKQPEFTLTVKHHLKLQISPYKIEEAKKQFIANKKLLEEVSQKYQVAPEYIVALWSQESDFGRYKNKTSTLSTLATLDYIGYRRDFFHHEFFSALKIVDTGVVAPENLKSSWAGAIGQCQFMPSQYFAKAVSFRGGRPDIWNNVADVFASTANYLQRNHWQNGQPVAQVIYLPKNFNPAFLAKNVKKTIGEWKQLGIRPLSGEVLGNNQIMTSILKLEKEGDQAYLIYPNFKVIKSWNNSNHFALTIATLANILVKPNSR